MRCFAALFEKIWLPPARWMLAWWLWSAKAPHLTRVSSRISCIALHTVVLVLQVEKTGEWAQCVKPWQTLPKGSELPGHEGKRMGRHCTSTGCGAAQSEGSALHRFRHTHKTKGFAEIARCAVTARGIARGTPAALHGQCHAMRALKTSKPSMFAAGDFQHFLNCTREEGQPIPCKIWMRRLTKWWSEMKSVTWAITLQCWEAWHNCLFTSRNQCTCLSQNSGEN